MDKYLQDQHIQLYEKDDLKTDIWIKNGQITVKKYDNRIGHQLFLMDNITFEYIKNVFETRVFSKKRPDLKILLNQLGLNNYNVYDIVKKTHGFMTKDSFWLKFDDEQLQYEDVRFKCV